MRNLKRALSLVLASVMVLGLMMVGSSAKSSDFKDYDEVTYKEAADVLNAIGIFIGDENGNFNPDQTLTRAMAAKIIATMILRRLYCVLLQRRYHCRRWQREL